MTRKKIVATTYVVAAGLLLALGAAARYSRKVPGEAPPGSGSGLQHGQMGSGMMRGQMGQGTVARNGMAARREMRNLVDELIDNQAVMEKAMSVRNMKPLLRKNHSLLEELNDEMARSWGMPGPMHGAGTSARMISHDPAHRQGGAAPAGKPARSSAQSRLVARGKEIYRADACHICHGEIGKGTKAGPSLVGVSKKYSAGRIGELIRHPATQKMPPFSASALPEADLKAVVAYVETMR